MILHQTPSISALRPYSPGGPLNAFATALTTPMRLPMSSGHRLQPGLRGYLIPFAPLAFVPHRRIRSGLAPSPQVVPKGLQDFTPTP
jgi:hypothetical protein